MNPPRLTVRSLGLTWATFAVLGCWGSAVQAGVVTFGPNPVALPNCPDPAQPGKCAVDTSAQVVGIVGGLAAVRIGQSGPGSLVIGDGANLAVRRLDLATGIPRVPDLVVGDNVGSAAGLFVKGSGRLSIDVPADALFNGGLVIGPFAAPQGHAGASTTMTIFDGGRVNVAKTGGLGVGSAVFVGQGAGPNSPNHGTAVISVRGTGFINAPTVLGEGGTLMGTGTVGPTVASFGGTNRPGFSPGTLTINGSYTDVGGHIEIEIAPTGRTSSTWPATCRWTARQSNST